MGWNQGYEIFESTVVGAYELGVLDMALLRVLMEPYRDTDIDLGGSRDLTARDGLSVEEIVIKLAEPERFALLDVHRQRIAAYPADREQSRQQQDDCEAYFEQRSDMFDQITDKVFGW